MEVVQILAGWPKGSPDVPFEEQRERLREHYQHGEGTTVLQSNFHLRGYIVETICEKYIKHLIPLLDAVDRHSLVKYLQSARNLKKCRG